MKKKSFISLLTVMLLLIGITYLGCDQNVDISKSDIKTVLDTFTVSFDNGGKGTKPDDLLEIDYNSKIKEPEKLTEKGYSFEGWYKDSKFDYKYNFEEDKITKNTTLYGKWTALEYTITYNLNDGSAPAVANPVKYTIETADIVLNNPTKEGYGFGGWYNNADFKGEKVTKIAKGSTGNLKLFAKWNNNEYTVSFDNGGKGSKPGDITKLHYNSLISEPEKPTENGYNFDGWYKDQNFKTSFNFAEDKITKDTTLYGKWTPVEYTITYNLNDGTAPAVANPVKYTIETADIVLNNPTKVGYGFDGWYNNADFNGDKITKITKGSTENLKLFAKWNAIPVTCTVNYYLQLEDGKSYSKEPSTTKQTQFNTGTVLTSSDLEKLYTTPEGFTYLKNDGLPAVKADGSSVYNLYYSRNRYTVTFNVNGHGSEPAKLENVIYGTKIKEPEALTDNNYIFGGWYTDEACSFKWNFTENKITKNTVLYAGWTEKGKIASVYFSVPTGAAIDKDDSVTLTCTTPGVKIYYTLDSSIPSAGSTLYTKAIVIDKAITIKAVAVLEGLRNSDVTEASYTLKTHKVSFENIDGVTYENNSNIALVKGDNILNGVKNVKALKTGYTFTHWTYSGAELKDQTMGKEDVSLTPVFTENSYTVKFAGLEGAESGTISDKTVKYTESFTLPAAPSKIKYIFKGWSKTNSLSDINNPNDSLNRLSPTNKGTVTFTAMWEDQPAPAAPVNTSPNTYFNKETKEKGGVDLTFKTPTDGVKIFYTTDGTEPALSATGKTKEYSQAVKINETCTVKAITVFNGVASKVVSTEFVLDDLAPGNVTVEAHTGDMKINLLLKTGTEKDIAKIRIKCTTDSSINIPDIEVSPNTNYEKEISGLTNGKEYSFTLYSIDKAGNINNGISINKIPMCVSVKPEFSSYNSPCAPTSGTWSYVRFGNYPKTEVNITDLGAPYFGLPPSWTELKTIGYDKNGNMYDPNINTGRSLTNSGMPGEIPSGMSGGSIFEGESNQITKRIVTFYRSTDGYYYIKEDITLEVTDTKYYRIEPIFWRIIDKNYEYNGTKGKLLVSETILDCAPYRNINSNLSSAECVYSSRNCYVKNYLKHTVMKMAFPEYLSSKMNIELLTEKQISNPNYGFKETSRTEDNARKREYSDFHKGKPYWLIQIENSIHDNGEVWWRFDCLINNSSGLHIPLGSTNELDTNYHGIVPVLFVPEEFFN